MTAWDPGHYLRFGDERTRPAADLASRVQIDAPKTVIDLGCGPGNSTQVLRQRWPMARVAGLDSSQAMIDAATASYPDQEWLLGDIAGWSSANLYDVVFSNAALQWVGDHAPLVAGLFRNVASGGALAFQVPSSTYALVRTLIHEVAHDDAWVARMDGPLTALTMEPPEVYYDALALAARSVDLWETEYSHVMESPAAIVDWISSTGLRPFLDVLVSAEERERFRGMLTERVTEGYPERSDGRVLFPFRRTFVIAYAP